MILKTETYMFALQKLLGTAEKFFIPEFGAALQLELRKEKHSNKYFVRISYKNTPYPSEKIVFTPLIIKG